MKEGLLRLAGQLIAFLPEYLGFWPPGLHVSAVNKRMAEREESYEVNMKKLVAPLL